MRPGSRPQDPCRPNGKRRPPLARAPPARSRVFGRTLLAALRPRLSVATGGGGTSARRPLRSLAFASPPPAAPAQRDRDAPSVPVALPRSAPALRRAAVGLQPAGDAPTPRLRRIREGCLRRLVFSNPPECPQLLAVTNEQLRNGARTVTADNILSTRVQRKARGSSVAARAPGRLAQREKEHLAPASYQSCGGREASRRCFLPEPPRSRQPSGARRGPRSRSGTGGLPG